MTGRARTLRPVAVVWIDSSSMSGTNIPIADALEFGQEPLEMRSAGIEIDHNKKFLVIATSVGGRDHDGNPLVSHVLQIPNTQVIRKKYMK